MTLTERIATTPVIGPTALWLKGHLTGTWKLNPGHWLPRLITNPVAQVVQIGSNDGKTGDPIYPIFQKRPGWKGLLVEPVPYIYERLRNNYADTSRFTCENTLINDGTSLTFYWVDEAAIKDHPNIPSWYDQLGSFNRQHITSHLPDFEAYIRQAQLPGITLAALLDKHSISQIDILHIDTEGYDYKILSQLPIERIQPRLILFERKHLSQQEEAEATAFLQPHYTQYHLKSDILALRKDLHQQQEHKLGPLQALRIK